MSGRGGDPRLRLQEAALAYADAEQDLDHARAWDRLRKAALAYRDSFKTPGPPRGPRSRRGTCAFAA